mgnify:CR=1 FL=1
MIPVHRSRYVLVGEAYRAQGELERSASMLQAIRASGKRCLALGAIETNIHHHEGLACAQYFLSKLLSENEINHAIQCTNGQYRLFLACGSPQQRSRWESELAHAGALVAHAATTLSFGPNEGPMADRALEVISHEESQYGVSRWERPKQSELELALHLLGVRMLSTNGKHAWESGIQPIVRNQPSYVDVLKV